jgi:ankyrin repeat protein
MKYIKLFENFEEYNPYDLMIMFPDERLKLFIEEIKKDEPNLNLVSDLINLGTINTQDDNNGNAPLYRAARLGKIEIAQMLIAAKADLNVQDEKGWTPLHWAAKFGRVEIARMLIYAGADVNVQDEEGDTPLHRAAFYEQGKIVRMLIDAGARKDIQTNNGKLPYDLAIFKELKNLLKP